MPRRASSAATDWPQIAGLYDVLLRADPSPVVELNRAAAIAMRDGPEAGLALIDAILARGELADYHFAYSARGDLCRRLGRTAEAIAAYERAMALTNQAPERRFLERRLAELRLHPASRSRDSGLGARVSRQKSHERLSYMFRAFVLHRAFESRATSHGCSTDPETRDVV